MNSFALITAIALAADFSLAAASIARARMLKACASRWRRLQPSPSPPVSSLRASRRIHRLSRQALPRYPFAQFG
jgi:hypothetical protein